MTSRERFEAWWYSLDGKVRQGMRFGSAWLGYQACEAEQRATQSGQDKVIAKLKEQLRCCRENVRRLKEREAEHRARRERVVERIEEMPDYCFDGTDLIHKYQALEILKQEGGL